MGWRFAVCMVRYYTVKYGKNVRFASNSATRRHFLSMLWITNACWVWYGWMNGTCSVLLWKPICLCFLFVILFYSRISNFFCPLEWWQWADAAASRMHSKRHEYILLLLLLLLEKTFNWRDAFFFFSIADDMISKPFSINDKFMIYWV